MQIVRRNWADAALGWIRKNQPSSRVEVLGGHPMLLEYPDEMSRLVLEFLGAPTGDPRGLGRN